MKDKKNTHPPTTVLLDMHAILHRAFHALPDFTGPHGEPTGALYGLSTFLFKVAEDLAPDHIIATYDLPEPTHRHEAFGAYKAQREKTDSALVAQLVASRDILHAFGIPFLEAKGFEADDILGTLTHAPSLAEHHLVIASGDMDTLQLVSGDRVVVYTLKRGVNETMLYNEHAVCERYGFPPRLVPDYKGLRGDPSDNIPGVQGIGEKTATTLITSFGDLDTLYKKLKEHPEQFEKAGITKRIMGLLLEQEDEARFGKELATIRLDAPVSVPSLSRVWREGIDPHALRETFLRFGFKSLVGRVAHLVGEETRGEVQKEEVREMVDTKTEQELSLALWLLDSDTLHPKYDEVCAYTKTRDPKRAREVLLGALEKEDLMRVYRDIELPLIPVVSRMEERGILFDRAYLAELSLRYHKEADTLAQKIYTLAGETFNINSPRQLGDILFKKLDIGGGKKTKRTATGQTSTRESELVKYESEHPIVHEVLEYREVQKLLSTYIDTFPFLLDAGDRLHAQFVQAGTTTGRMSSQNPNMQNISSSHGGTVSYRPRREVLFVAPS
jgi:DNA polymerase-1